MATVLDTAATARGREGQRVGKRGRIIILHVAAIQSLWCSLSFDIDTVAINVYVATTLSPWGPMI